MKAAVYYGSHDVRIEKVADATRAAGEAVAARAANRDVRHGCDRVEGGSAHVSGHQTAPGDRPHRSDDLRARVHRRGRRRGRRADGLRSATSSHPVPVFRAVSAIAASRAARTSVAVITRSGSTRAAVWPSWSRLRRRILARVPDGLSLDYAGLAQPLAVGLHAARRSGVS